MLADERGSAIVLVSLAMTGLLAVVALAVDVGMLFTTRSEAQRAADSAALAGAGSLIYQPGDEERARSVAIEFGEQNPVANVAPEILPEDVIVDLDNDRVTVTVRRIEERGSAVATWFANVFGVSQVDVAARATAEAAAAGMANCVKPFTIPDKYKDNNGNNEFDLGIDLYEPSETGYGTDYRNPGQPGDDGLGYINDFGRPIVIKGGGPDQGGGCCPNTGPSWYYLWAYDGTGGSNVRDNIRTPCANGSPITVGEEYENEPGSKTGPVFQGSQDLFDLDPYAEWDEGCNCVAGSKYGESWESSERIGYIPVFHPGREFEAGRKPIEFTNFIAIFIESVGGDGNDQELHARILYPTGIAGGDSPAAPGLKAVRLIE